MLYYDKGTLMKIVESIANVNVQLKTKCMIFSDVRSRVETLLTIILMKILCTIQDGPLLKINLCYILSDTTLFVIKFTLSHDLNTNRSLFVIHSCIIV